MAKNIEKEIADLQGAINSPATPEAQKVVMRNILAKLQSQIKTTAKTEPKKAKYQSFGEMLNKTSKTMLGNDNGKDVEKFYSKPKKATTPKAIEVDWEFIEKYTPDYSSNYDVTASDDLSKFIDGEMDDEDYQNNIVSEFGEITEKEAEALLIEVDEKLMKNAIAEYEEQTGKKYAKSDWTKEKKEYDKVAYPKAKKSASSLDDYDCDELIEKEKEKVKKRKANALKKASEPKKTEATKNKERIEKVTEVIETNIEKRIEKGQVSKSELQKLIAETEALLTKLKKAFNAL